MDAMKVRCVTCRKPKIHSLCFSVDDLKIHYKEEHSFLDLFCNCGNGFSSTKALDRHVSAECPPLAYVYQAKPRRTRRQSYVVAQPAAVVDDHPLVPTPHPARTSAPPPPPLFHPPVKHYFATDSGQTTGNGRDGYRGLFPQSPPPPPPPPAI